MIIKLYESKLFTLDPAIRFAREYGVDKQVWNELWKRHLAEYDTEALAGYFIYKTEKRITTDALRRWFRMADVYCRANHIMLMGIRVVQSEYFGEYEELVLKEVLRGIKYSKVKEPRIVL